MTRQAGQPPARSAQPETQPGMPMEILGMYLFIASEFILFITLLFILFWLRSGLVADWPPPDQPRLPIGITGINTVFLLVSGYSMHRAYRAVKQNASRQLTRWLMVTCVLGVVFLTVQGFEWIRLIQFGLSMTSSLYGAMFYTIIGLHAVHVLVTVLVLLYLWVRSSAGAYTAEKHTGVVLGYMFWLFVVLIWPILYVLVYLV
ncbi:MAG: heme-copper oxidase subunit III [Gemmatimonadetes bacterium]|nr:heme-copper oxidase subunit III [Gemmatimonadota bacterium]MYD25281.1 heme-copper oxidase subunit III [Gemmatimonadota bacterium]MYI98949.1 heme-copper oxidase subunit III [Gemmatimonadota bacterium]